MVTPGVSVVLPTHRPDPGRLQRAIDALRWQTLPLAEWELVLVDNASGPSSAISDLDLTWHPNARCVAEPNLGLTMARERGFRSTTGAVIVLVDDDNVLAPDYLAHSAAFFSADPRLGAAGGRSIAEFEIPPADWMDEFLDLLAVRDLGPAPISADASATDEYPRCAPIGAGMVLRREALAQWLENHASRLRPTDRKGQSLTSGGDNDIVLTLLDAGWQVAYRPELVLTHLIPSTRLEPRYLGRLNFGVQKSWVDVLDRHGRRPWRPIPRWTLPLRAFRARLRRRVWRGPAQFVRWRGDCGRLAGQAELSRASDRA